MARTRSNAPNLAGISDAKLRSMLRTYHERIAAIEVANAEPAAVAATGISQTTAQSLVAAAISQLRQELGLTPAQPSGTFNVTPTPPGTSGAPPATGGGTSPPPGGSPGPPPTGQPSPTGRAFMDNGGPYLSFGATCFPLLYGFLNFRDRLAQNLSFLATNGVQYVRALGDVGPAGWSDREIDSNMADYSTRLAACTDWVYDNFGMRVQWTIFGGTQHRTTAASRQALVDTFTAMITGREQKIFLLEIANEAWKNGFEGAGGLAELRALTARAMAATTAIVAPTSEGGAGYSATDIYSGGYGDAATFHFDRTGDWMHVARQPYGVFFISGVPQLISNNEPIGPESSVAQDADPLHLAIQAATGYLTGVGDFCFHCGPGVRLGGAEDLALGRHSNYWEVPGITDIFNAMRNVRSLLSPNAANSAPQNTNGSFPSRPWDFSPSDADLTGLVNRCYSGVLGSAFASVVIGIAGSFSLVARQAVSSVKVYDVRDITNPLVNTSLAIGGTIDFNTGFPQGVVIVGQN